MTNLFQLAHSGVAAIDRAPVATHASLRADDVWGAIDRLARDHGLTSSGLARKAGLDPTSFNRSKRQINERDRWPSSSSIAKVLDATGESFLNFALRVTALQEARMRAIGTRGA